MRVSSFLTDDLLKQLTKSNSAGFVVDVEATTPKLFPLSPYHVTIRHLPSRPFFI
jgi:hypothetical protein